jgi:hypothetical protein
MIAMLVGIALALQILVEVLGNELRKMIPILGDVVHAQSTDIMMHFLVAIDLIR